MVDEVVEEAVDEDEVVEEAELKEEEEVHVFPLEEAEE